MAMRKCPECGNDISDKAYSCPHCGYPIREPEKTKYSLVVGQPTQSGFAVFLKVCAFICWIGGLILAIVAGNVSVGYGGTEFRFGVFLTALIPYVIYGIIFFCMATVVQQISDTYDIIRALRLVASEEKGQSGKNSSNSKPTYLSRPKAASGDWKCTKCGTWNPSSSISCKDCGTYR